MGFGLGPEKNKATPSMGPPAPARVPLPEMNLRPLARRVKLCRLVFLPNLNSPQALPCTAMSESLFSQHAIPRFHRCRPLYSSREAPHQRHPNHRLRHSRVPRWRNVGRPDPRRLSQPPSRAHPRLPGFRRRTRTPPRITASSLKLLFDENVSPRLVEQLNAEYPASAHVETLGLRGHSDSDIWNAAAHGGFLLVSKDGDLRQRSFTLGPPPKVVWLSVGNAGTQQIVELLRRNRDRILTFERVPEEALLVLTLIPE
jgi:predicted nuclease of predicted toxin-antitoxin system